MRPQYLVSLLALLPPTTQAARPQGGEQRQLTFASSSHETPFDTSSLLLTSLNGHLKSWNSAFAPNGFGVVPATIPVGTIMYHAREAGPPPSEGFDWFAFDAEHSYIFTGGPDSVLWHFTATRPLRALYFDGSSAAKTAGPIDVQEILAYNKTLGGRKPGGGGGFSDFVRYADLCDWAKPYGLDGFIREESTFEYVQCDFSSPAIKLVRGVNVTVTITNDTSDPFPGPGGPTRRIAPSGALPDYEGQPEGPPGRPGPGGGGRGRPQGRRRNVYQSQTHWLYQRAASWHHHRPDPRVWSHPEYFVSFYDPRFSSMAAVFPLSRGQHNLSQLSPTDSESFRMELHDVLKAWNADAPTSGVDWTGVASAAHARYAAHLNELRHVLSSRSNSSNSTSVVDEVRLITFGMLLPYVSGPDALSVFPSPPSPAARAKSLAETAEACTGGFTAFLSTELMTSQELRIKGALEGVLSRVCGVATRLLGNALELVDNAPEKLKDPKVVEGTLARWKKDLGELMAWLGWPEWVRCERLCELDEVCYAPAPLFEPSGDFEPECRRKDFFL